MTWLQLAFALTVGSVTFWIGCGMVASAIKAAMATPARPAAELPINGGTDGQRPARMLGATTGTRVH